MLSSNLIPEHLYNGLPDINDTQAPTKATLQSLGRLFSEFGVEDLVGVGLLHKHFDLAPDTVMVHDDLVCGPKSIHDLTLLAGNAFFWDGTNFQAFEYGQEEALALPNEFVDAFAHHLQSNTLSQRFALVKLKGDLVCPPPKVYMEYCDFDTKSHVCEEVAEILPHEATKWTFSGGVPFVTHGCKRTEGGQGEHKTYK